MEVRLPPLEGHEREAWRLLFSLYEEFKSGWAVVGAQMVVLHAGAFGVPRPVRTVDTDVLVDVRAIDIQKVAGWLRSNEYDLDGISAEGIGHRFININAGVRIDILSIDHSGNADRTTVPPARTVEVPGGRNAIGRIIEASIETGELMGKVPLPGWLGAVTLKARAAVEFGSERGASPRPGLASRASG